MSVRSVRDLEGDAIVARDGAIGFIADVYFDDERWSVRYLVVDTGRSMPQRRVLIAPAAIERGVPPDESVRVALTRKQVERSPDAEDVLPVWRQHELSYAGRAASDPHLRSAEIVASCSVAARDGAIGHVDDFVVDGERWTITGLVVATSLWSGGKRVVVPPQAVERIDWPYHVVHLGLARDAVRRLPSLERPG
jgi:sporulation protein YlmC with PRC-barrel domain